MLVSEQSENLLFIPNKSTMSLKNVRQKTLINEQQSSNRITVQEHHTHHTVHTALPLVHDETNQRDTQSFRSIIHPVNGHMNSSVYEYDWHYCNM